MIDALEALALSLEVWPEMMDTYEDRKVDCYESDTLLISTARVLDGDKPFETAVEHPDYNEGEMVIVEAYDTEEEAKSGHDRWVHCMTTDPPEQLVDCRNSFISQVTCEEEE
jgi:hypothetical protein